LNIRGPREHFETYNLDPPSRRVWLISPCQSVMGYKTIEGGYSVRKAPRKGLFRTNGLMQSQTGRVGGVGGVGGNRRDEQSSGVQRGRGNRETGGRCRRWALGDRGSVGRSQSGFYHLRVSNKRLAAPLGEYRHLTRDDNYVPIF